MAVHVLRWQGPKRREASRLHVEGVVDTWASEWFVTPPADVTARLRLEDGVNARMRWFSAAAGEPAMWLGMPETALAPLGRRMLGLEASSADLGGMDLDVAVNALSDLLGRLCGEGQAAWVDADANAPSDGLRLERFGNLGFELDLPSAQARLHVNAAWCERFAPSSSPRPLPSLSQRSQALAHSRVSVQAVVELGSLPLADSFGWKVGEVLVTDARTDALVRVQSNGRQVANGKLLAEPGPRAVQLATDII